SAGEIRIVDDVIARQRKAPRSRSRIWQWKFLDLHGLRIDGRNLVGAKFDKDRNAFGIDHDPVWPRVRRRRGNQLDLTALGVEPTNLVGSLGGEPQYAGLIEVERVRVLHRRVGHFVFGDVTGLRIELANQAGTIAGEPDIAVL